MSTLANLITQHAATEAAAEDWAAVAAIIRGLGLRQTPRLCYSVESGDAIEAAGDDPTTVIGAMLLDPNGTMLFQRLSSSAGVQWAHPRTRQWLAWFVAQNRISQAGAEALINLSAPLLYSDLTGEQCRSEFRQFRIFIAQPLDHGFDRQAPQRFQTMFTKQSQAPLSHWPTLGLPKDSH